MKIALLRKPEVTNPRYKAVCAVAFESISVNQRKQRAVVTFNRPAKMNPLDWSTIKEIRAALAQIESDPEVRAVVFTGAGKAFSAGGDLERYLTLYREPDKFRAFLEDFFGLCADIEQSPRLYIAAVNGACVAGGLELLLACDLAIAGDEARIGDGHLNFGQIPGAGGSQRLPRAIGTARAKHLMFTGRLIDGREAERIGLVAEVVPQSQLLSRVDELVDDLVAKSSACITGMKYLVNHGLRGSLESGLRLEMAYVHNYATTHPDAIEGLIAFKEKRRPRFVGT